ncbi:hypothetical protein [Autumnicola musiva]|uniref:Uncharacterized protein n=1 Tax=Autumnicola musiva TaxID=3075589 RepID=A0ABU3D640_9FLAO|nr:hypothetical protein [Zunongwangia sp. F117]MDT0677002.1 hypothetical protein [Zunongwangia sp. F117]
MIAPNQAANIYPRSIKNIKALLLKLELIAIEEVARPLNTHYDVLQAELREDQLTLSNAFHYGEDALINYPKLNGSKNWNRITGHLRNRILSLDTSK